MNKLHLSQNISTKENEIIEDLPPIELGNTEIIGYKISHLTKDYSHSGKQGEPTVIVDKSVNPIYDDITQLFIDRNDLQSMLAHSTAQNAKSNIDTQELKKQNAELTQQIAKMQIQNKKG